jgi:glycosyltransferase involved in cell wall biosynthesis
VATETVCSKSLLDVPNAFAQWAQVPSRLVFEGADHRAPLLTIAIPTFRRGALLVEAVRSAVEQDWTEPFEVIVVDNDPESTGVAPLLEALPQLADVNFRYFVNVENTGMFGNWNRSIELARAEWYTILHDDDLLQPEFASRMMAILDHNPEFDGVICRRDVFGPTVVPRRSRVLDLARRLGTEVRFRGKGTRRFRPDRFFWSATNPVGLIARKRDLIALGGYQPGEWPSSDHYFQLRFALKHRLIEARDYLVRIRLLENESIKPETYLRMAVDFHHLRAKMAGSVVPHWWMHASGLILAEQRKILCNSDYPVTREAMEDATGARLPRGPHPRLLTGIKAMLGGF